MLVIFRRSEAQWRRVLWILFVSISAVPSQIERMNALLNWLISDAIFYFAMSTINNIMYELISSCKLMTDARRSLLDVHIFRETIVQFSFRKTSRDWFMIRARICDHAILVHVYPFSLPEIRTFKGNLIWSLANLIMQYSYSTICNNCPYIVTFHNCSGIYMSSHFPCTEIERLSLRYGIYLRNSKCRNSFGLKNLKISVEHNKIADDEELLKRSVDRIEDKLRN